MIRRREQISIHAPAKGATCPRPGRGRKDSISIHAPAKGATWRGSHTRRMEGVFQSTLPRRERPTAHTPARSHGHFNPRSREGSDLGYDIDAVLQTDFNPRSREGSDFTLKKSASIPIKFQSTLPRRERHLKLSSDRMAGQFQSTLPRRERHTIRQATAIRRYFNPRSREGSDALTRRQPRSSQDFNPRSREGSDISQAQLLQDWRISIHAPAKGATRKYYAKRYCAAFQSTLPRRERP